MEGSIGKLYYCIMETVLQTLANTAHDHETGIFENICMIAQLFIFQMYISQEITFLTSWIS